MSQGSGITAIWLTQLRAEQSMLLIRAMLPISIISQKLINTELCTALFADSVTNGDTWIWAVDDVDGSRSSEVPQTSGLVLRSTHEQAPTPRVQGINVT